MTRSMPYLPKWIALGLLGAALAVALGASSSFSSGDISPLETVIRGQSTWLAGGPASLRIIVTNHETGRPIAGRVGLGIAPTDQQSVGRRQLFAGRLREGTVEAKFLVPDVPPGRYELTVQVSSSLGSDEVKRPINITRQTQILLTTDKPLYQPGQTIHLRALALRRPSLTPAAGQQITLEVEDAKGNKVFKQTTAASKFGIVSADFTLADEINLGPYTVRAIGEEGQAERSVEVKRYVLPKFKVSLTTDRTYYLPGEKLTGKVQCDYFFGKPTSQSDVLITLSTFDVAFREFARIEGKTDAGGLHKFEADLPEYFVGQPLEQGSAFIKLDVEVTDRAEHIEKITSTVPIAKEPLIITAVPESGAIKPGLTNTVYLLFSRPDGQPVKSSFSVKVAGVAPQGDMQGGRTSDEMGLAEVSILPQWSKGKESLELTVEAGAVRRTFALPTEPGAAALLLRADRALAKVGDQVEFTVISTKQQGTTYVDVIRDNQTILTRAVDLAGGRSEFTLPLTQDLQGTLEVHAYQILPDENIIRDTRRIYVAPADDLVVEVRADKQTYRPGGQAKLTFAVRDQRGKPTLAALGLTIVDESVFALQEMQPGLERIYFALEKELLKPRYEIHGFTPEGIISGRLPFETPKPAEEDAARQRAAAVLFAAAQPRDPYTLTVNTYDERVEQAMEEWIKGVARDAERIDRALQRYYQLHRAYLIPNEDILSAGGRGAAAPPRAARSLEPSLSGALAQRQLHPRLRRARWPLGHHRRHPRPRCLGERRQKVQSWRLWRRGRDGLRGGGTGHGRDGHEEGRGAAGADRSRPARSRGPAPGPPAPVLPRDHVRQSRADHRRAGQGRGHRGDGRLHHHLAPASARLLAAGPARQRHRRPARLPGLLH